MKKPFILLALLISLTLILTLLFQPLAPPTPATAASPPLILTTPLTSSDIFVVRVYYQDKADIALLHNYDLFEYNNLDEQYVLVAVDQAQYQTLTTLKPFRLEIDDAQTAAIHPPRPLNTNLIDGIPGYACYRTVEETYTTAQDIATAYPNLATWIDIGDSWEKTQNNGGYDLMVLKLTNSAIPGPKPKLFISAAIHAREYTPAELATRYAEYLINNYDTDADVTWLLDYHEIHLLLQANPDARKHAETGIFWRKNTNNNFCSDTNNRGVDLNRNYAFGWDCCNGHDTNECGNTFNGTSAASEPEVQAIQTYLSAEFPDQRPPDINTAAPLTTTGIFLDLHSYSNVIITPWSFSTNAPPNASEIQTFARKLAYFNNYTADQAANYYIADGASMDYGYGELGIPSYVIELGNVFYEACSEFNDVILPDNLDTLIYAAKVARTPYMTPLGPDALTPTADPAHAQSGTTTTLAATLNDTNYNNNNGTEASQNIAAAEYYIDTPPWDTANSPVAFPMTATDGNFNSDIEAVTATLDTTGLALGRHIIFVRGQDTDGNWGAVSALFLTVQPAGAHIDVATDLITSQQQPNTIVTRTLSLTNIGFAPLTWSVAESAAADCSTTTDLPWLSVTAANGTTAVATTDLLTLTFDATGLSDALYTGYLCLTNDDVDPADQLQIIPINMDLMTITCTTYPSIDVGGSISNGTLISASPVITSGTIVDINLTNITGTYPRTMREIEFFLDGPPLFIRLSLLDDSCGNIADFDFTFDDDGLDMDCDINDNGTYHPYSTLSSYNGEDAAGIWYLHIVDSSGPRSGTLTSWSLEVCTATPSVCTAPTAITDLTATPTNPDILLTWANTAPDYELWSANTAWFDTTGDCTAAPNCTLISGTNTATGTDHAATPGLFTYFVKSRAACGATATPSNHTGAFTYPLTLP